MSKKFPTKIWTAGVNHGGLWSKEPIRMRLHHPKWLPASAWHYVSACGNLTVEKLGLDFDPYPVVRFASVCKKDVRLFIAGVRAMARQMAYSAHTELVGVLEAERKAEKEEKR